MTDNKIKIIDCGLKDYNSTLLLQENIVKNLLETGCGQAIIIVEHNPVITLGARQSANKLLANIEDIKKAGIEVVQIKRGGGITAHNPGQIVAYPIINLKNRSLSISQFVRLLEESGIELLAQLGLTAERKKGFPGLWVGEKKIASIGVQVKKWITFHGIAINICNDLQLFDYFVPCGLDGVQMTSAQRELGRAVNIDDAKKKFKEILMKIWNIK